MSPHDIWSHWGGTPLEVAVIIIPTIWYAWGVRALWARAGTGHGVTTRQAVAFASGTVALLIALLSPLDPAAEALFSAHMVQHMLLIVVAAPLWVIGAPLLPSLWALPVRTRRGLARWWHAHRTLRAIVAGLGMPLSVFIMHTIALWFWHFPGPYQAALRNQPLHALEHAAFFGTALCFWWSVIQPIGRRHVSRLAALVMVAGIMIQGSALGAILLFATHPWYPAHGPGARAWGITLLADQQLAGLIMWIPAGIAYIAAALWLLLGLIRDDEEHQPRRSPAAASSITA